MAHRTGLIETRKMSPTFIAAGKPSPRAIDASVISASAAASPYPQGRVYHYKVVVGLNIRAQKVTQTHPQPIPRLSHAPQPPQPPQPA